jgi:hypothetical protein
MNFKLIIRYIFLSIGIIVGIFHLKQGLKAMFVFRANEPISMWVSVIAGPLSILPAVLVSFFLPKVGGLWLICGSIVSIVAFLTTTYTVRDIVWYLLAYSFPMFIFGFVALKVK